MVDSTLPIADSDELLQTYKNLKNGLLVHSEAVTPTDSRGKEIEHSRDINNEQAVPLAALGVFEGEFTYVGGIDHFEILYAADTPFTAQKIWSGNGVDALDRTITDLVTDGTDTATSEAGSFTDYDKGATITGTNLAAGTKIIAVVDRYTITLSQPATGSGTNSATLASDFSPSTITQQVVNGFNVAYDVNEGRNTAPYYKLKITNGATPQTAFAGLTGFISLIWLVKTPYQGSFGTLTAALNNLSRALLVRSVPAGVEPDGITFTNAPADGIAYENTTSLGAGANLVGTIFDIKGHRTVALNITTDQVSGSNGVRIKWYADAAGTMPVLPDTKRTFTADDAAEGGATYIIIPRARYGKLDYTNGATPQGAFRATVTLHASPLASPTGELGGSVSLTSLALMGLNMLMAADDSDAVDIIRRAAGGGVRVAVNEHEANTPIKPDSGLTMSTGTVDTTGAKIVDSTAIPAGATGCQIQASNANGNPLLYLATSQAGAQGGANAGVDLAAGQSQYYSVGELLNNDIWGAAQSSTVRWRLTWIQGGGA